MHKKTAGLLLGSAFLAIASFSAFSFVNKNKDALSVSATQHASNYDAYAYSGSYYNSITNSATTLTEGMNGTLRSTLTTLIHPTNVPVYSGSGSTHLSTVLQYADADPTNSSNMVYLYTRDSVTKNAASSWNREHVWPKSLSNNCWEESRAGTDLLHLRPTYNDTNTARGSLKYGNVSGASALTYNNMTYGYKNNTYFMPLDSVKGDVARICMYVWTAYYNEYGSNLPPLTNVFESYDVLMSWHTSDPPDVMEGNRNNYAQNTSMQGNRNPFVDHPEYAWKIFGSQCSASVLNAAKAAYPDNGSSSDYVTISNSTASIQVNGSTTLSATSSNSSTITWTTGNSNIASISSGSAASGTSITVTGVAAGSTTITASATINSRTYTADCAVTVSSSSSGNSLSITYSDLPTSYQTGTTVYTAASGVKFQAYNCANYSSKMQFKASGGYLQNTESLSLQSIKINDRESNTLTVYGSTTAGSFSTTITGTDDLYDLSGYNYFKVIRSSSGAAYCSSIDITLASSSSNPTLSSIAVSTAPTKTSYTAGEYFDPTGLVITRNYTNPTSTDTYTYAGHTSEFTFSPNTSTALTTSNTSVTITYGGKSTTQAITVTSGGSSQSEDVYQKVTSASDLTNGRYLIVHESSSVAFNGGLSSFDAAQNTISVSISNSKIESNSTTDAASFTINTSTGALMGA